MSMNNILSWLKKNFLPISTILFSVILILLSLLLYFFPLRIFTDQTSLIQFGTYFGGVVSPIFTFFTVVILIITFQVQKEGLKLANKEIESAKNDRKKQELFYILNEFDSHFKDFDWRINDPEDLNSLKDMDRIRVNYYYNELFAMYIYCEQLYSIDNKAMILGYYGKKYDTIAGHIMNLRYGEDYSEDPDDPVGPRELIKFFRKLVSEFGLIW